MAHSIANLEHHHFKYVDFRRPGDAHVHFYGAATGSFTKNVKGEVFEIDLQAFGRIIADMQHAYPPTSPGAP